MAGIQKLNLPEYSFRIKNENGNESIFDEIRKKFILLTPEEWVRQNFIRFLVSEKKFPVALIAVEKKVEVNGRPQRFDLLVYNRNGLPLMIAEFKAPDVKITQESFDQVARYNMALKVEYIVVSNGLSHFSCRFNFSQNSYSYLKTIPAYDEICSNQGAGFS